MPTIHQCPQCRFRTEVIAGVAIAVLCSNCGMRMGGGPAVATVTACPTHYVTYRGWSQEVDTTHYETCDDENKRFSLSGRRTPLDPLDAKLEVWGHSPSDVLAKFKEALESAPWEEHYRAIIDRINKLENAAEAYKAVIDRQAAVIKGLPQPSASEKAPSSPPEAS